MPPQTAANHPASKAILIADHVLILSAFRNSHLQVLVELSPFHFSRVFKQTTGMSPLQFVTRERITRAQQLIRAVTAAKQPPGFQTSHSLIEIALEVGYASASYFAQSLPPWRWRDADGVSQRLVRRLKRKVANGN